MTSDTKVYPGSCHCGNIKYQIRLTLPPPLDLKDAFGKRSRIYKCNCSTCLKLNMFHCRPADPVTDFILTSPSTIDQLGIYDAFGGPVNWHFCPKCGTQCFAVGANWVQEELDVGNWVSGDDGQSGSSGPVQKVWKTSPLEGLKGLGGGPLHFVSVNAVTLEGVDLIEWHDKKWIFYVENRVAEKGSSRRELQFGKPYPGGCY